VRSKQDIKSVADIPRRRKEWAAALFGGERLDAADARDSSSLSPIKFLLSFLFNGVNI